MPSKPTKTTCPHVGSLMLPIMITHVYRWLATSTLAKETKGNFQQPRGPFSCPQRLKYIVSFGFSRFEHFNALAVITLS